jgi:molybdate transport system regulatory protein
MVAKSKRKFSYKFWLECNGKPVLGKGGVQILQQIKKEGSLTKAAANLSMSYRYVWSYMNKIEKALGEPVVDTHKGGKLGGGGAKLTEVGESLLNDYKHLEDNLHEFFSCVEYREVIGSKISARNRFKGKVIAVEKDGVTAKVKVEVKEPTVVTALISKEAVEDLNIKVGDAVEAIVKATEVIIAK